MRFPSAFLSQKFVGLANLYLKQLGEETPYPTWSNFPLPHTHAQEQPTRYHRHSKHQLQPLRF